MPRQPVRGRVPLGLQLADLFGQGRLLLFERNCFRPGIGGLFRFIDARANCDGERGSDD